MSLNTLFCYSFFYKVVPTIQCRWIPRYLIERYSSFLLVQPKKVGGQERPKKPHSYEMHHIGLVWGCNWLQSHICVPLVMAQLPIVCVPQEGPRGNGKHIRVHCIELMLFSRLGHFFGRWEGPGPYPLSFFFFLARDLQLQNLKCKASIHKEFCKGIYHFQM